MNIKVLAIGNSFSDDATRYLHDIAKADGIDMKVVNLYIGGCSLRQHYINMLNDAKAYSLRFNGYSTGFYVSIREALQSDDWDVVTMQQASHQSPFYDTYQPYLEELSKYVSVHAPKAKQVLHQTWAYEEGSERLTKELGFVHQEDMFVKIKESIGFAANSISADGIIPCGQTFQNLIVQGVGRIHRDTYHASHGVGRYALALTWYEAITGRSLEDNSFCEFDEEISPIIVKVAKRCAHLALREYGSVFNLK